MTQPLRAVPAAPAGDIETFLPSYVRYLRSEDVVAGTIDKYVTAVTQLREWLAERGESTAVAEIQRDQLRAFMTHVLCHWKSSTANTKFYSLKSFFNYLHEDGEIRWHPMEGMSPPPAPAPEVPVLSNEDIAAMLATCKTKSFEDRRDAALIMVLLDTGGRVSEVANLAVGDLTDGAARVMGKGRKPRTVFYGVSTARILDRYLRARDRHPHASSDSLWLGKRGPMTRYGIRDILERRAAAAGIEHVHPHQFRHTFAAAWLADGGHETDLMRLTGWSSRSMLQRYAAATADARAAEHYRQRKSPADRLKDGK